MPYEAEFIGSLQAVVLHQIKHDQPIYHQLTPILEARDEGRWETLSTAEKKAMVQDLQQHLAVLTSYYESYPHEWSRRKFGLFVAALKNYAKELAAEA